MSLSSVEFATLRLSKHLAALGAAGPAEEGCSALSIDGIWGACTSPPLGTLRAKALHPGLGRAGPLQSWGCALRGSAARRLDCGVQQGPEAILGGCLLRWHGGVLP